MKLLLDQGLPRSAVRLLQQAGIDAVHVGEIGLSEADDDVILERGRVERRIVITLDADFHAQIALSGATRPSVVRFRIGCPLTVAPWLAGISSDVPYGSSDEWSYKAAEHPAYCYDLHGTLLHPLGIDHERLTFRHNGIDRRLTDVHGQVITQLIA